MSRHRHGAGRRGKSHTSEPRIIPDPGWVRFFNKPDQGDSSRLPGTQLGYGTPGGIRWTDQNTIRRMKAHKG